MKNHMIFSKYVFFVGPALLVSVEYINPGNWVTAIEGGSRFGYELIWTVVLSNFVAIFLQSLAARLGLVTGKHLAQVCHDEYPQAVCVSLWLLCEASLLVLDIAMILGSAVGLNLLLGLPIVTCVLLVATDVLFLMFILPFLGVRKAELVPVSVVGVVLFSVVLTALFSEPSSSQMVAGLVPQLRRDNLYTTVSLLGANIAPHNLYLHSALVLVQRNASNLSIKVYSKQMLLDVLISLGAATLVNLAVLLVAAASFHNAGLVVLTLQDASILTYVLSEFISCLAFGLALLYVGQLSTLTGTIVGQIVMEGFIGTNVDAWLHRLFIRAAAFLPAFLCAWRYGNEGIYQTLIFSQILLGLQLPFMAIPLIKASSSESCMGSYKSTVLVEAVAWIIVTIIFLLNLSLVLSTLLLETDEWIGSTSWGIMGGLGWNHVKFGETSSSFKTACMLVIVGLFVSFFVWLILTPIKSIGHRPRDSVCVENYVDMITDNGLEKPETIPAVSELKAGAQGPLARRDRKDDFPLLTPGVLPLENEGSVALETAKVFYNGHEQTDGFEPDQSCKSERDVKDEVFESNALPQRLDLEMVDDDLLEPCKVTQLLSNIPDFKPFQVPQRAVRQAKVSQFEFGCDSNQVDILVSPSAPSIGMKTLDPIFSLASTPEESTPAIMSRRTMNILDDLDSPALEEAEAEADADLMEKEEDDVDGWEIPEHEEVVADIQSELKSDFNSVVCDETESGRSIGGKSDTSEGGGGGSGSGSLSRLSGLGRAARRHFASILDDFWSKLFDLHGQALLPSKRKLQGLVTNITNKQNGRAQLATSKEVLEQNGNSGLSKQGWRAGYKQSFISEPSQSPVSASMYDCFQYGLPQGTHTHGAPRSYADSQFYSSMRFPSYHEEVDYQPATIHGYGAASNRRSSIPISPKARPLHLGIQPLSSNNYGRVSPREPKTEPSLRHVMRRPETVSSNVRNLDNRLQVGHVPFDCLSQSFKVMQHSNDSLTNNLAVNSQFEEQSIPYKEGRLQQASISFNDSQKDPFPRRGHEKWNPLVCRATGELDISLANLQTMFQVNKRHGSFGGPPIGRGANSDYSALHVERTPLAFDQIAPSQMHLDGFSLRTSSRSDNHSLWSRQPFEQLFGTSYATHDQSLLRSGDTKIIRRPEDKVFNLSNEVQFGIEVLECLRECIARLLQLEGSDWLFRVDNGCDEDLIAAIAAHEKFLLDSDSQTPSRGFMSDDQSSLHSESHSRIEDTGLSKEVPFCGDGCIWGAPVLISFGVWSIHRILELSLMESRPELWGKYTYVLNHLQGILEPAFARPRTVTFACVCIQSVISDQQKRRYSRSGSSKGNCTRDLLCFPSNASSSQSYPYLWPWGRNTTIPNGIPSASVLFVDMIKEVEAAVGSRKGRTGTAAGDVAFPKGKENLASVLKRYKRRLGNKPANISFNAGGIGKKDVGLAPAAFLHLLHVI